METFKRTILVPYDFSPRADFALQHGVQISKMLDNSLTLLHITSDSSMEDEAKRKLVEVAEDIFKRYKTKPLLLVKTGKVSKEIKEIAIDIQATLVIMKTDIPKGRDRIFGSRAIKTIYGAQVPFIVVQGPPLRYNIKRVVVPFDFRRENKEKLKWINFISRFYKSEIHIFRPNKTD